MSMVITAQFQIEFVKGSPPFCSPLRSDLHPFCYASAITIPCSISNTKRISSVLRSSLHLRGLNFDAYMLFKDGQSNYTIHAATNNNNYLEYYSSSDDEDESMNMPAIKQGNARIGTVRFGLPGWSGRQLD